MKKTILIGGVAFLLGFALCYLMKGDVERYDGQTNSDPQKNGYVSDENIAIKVVEAICLPIYGKEILHEKPFHVALKHDSIWVVEGVLDNGQYEAGGGVYVEIQKKDCKILTLTHYK